MLTVKVEKSEHGGYIAKQEGDNPLRYIAAAGETEAAAVSALFDYHADLIRKGRIEVKEVTKGIRPGDVIPDLEPRSMDEVAEDHGKIVTRAMWRYLLPFAHDIEPKPSNGEVDSLICRVISNCFYDHEMNNKTYNYHGARFSIGEDVIKWLNLAFSCRTRLERNDGIQNGRNPIRAGLYPIIAKAMFVATRPHRKCSLKLAEKEIADVIEYIFSVYKCFEFTSHLEEMGLNEASESKVSFHSMGLLNQFLVTMFRNECSLTIDRVPVTK
jgi:hypothetical protein